MLELIPDVKSYDWGKLGDNSEVAKLACLNDKQFISAGDKPYAEWWMGDHISGPSKLKTSTNSTNKTLAHLINADTNLIGGMKRLPFLLKVLSIKKPLSIQVHPNKEEAEHLFNSSPDLYKDPNHKPELAIALTPFLALCGFRPYDELYEALSEFKPLSKLIGLDNIETIKSDGKIGLEKCFAKLMRSNEKTITNCIEELNEIFAETTSNLNNDRIELFKRIQIDFPNDVGSLGMFFLNIIKLEPGEAIFLAAKEPHAYLDGDCIECMACSDNVIRAGLTPKFKDVELLISMVNYDGEEAEKKLFQPKQINQFATLFKPSVQDFAVVKYDIPTTEQSYQIPNRKFGSILIVLGGKCEASYGEKSKLVLERGSVIFIPSDQPFVDLAIDNDFGNFVTYQAMYNDF